MKDVDEVFNFQNTRSYYEQRNQQSLEGYFSNYSIEGVSIFFVILLNITQRRAVSTLSRVLKIIFSVLAKLTIAIQKIKIPLRRKSFQLH